MISSLVAFLLLENETLLLFGEWCFRIFLRGFWQGMKIKLFIFLVRDRLEA